MLYIKDVRTQMSMRVYMCVCKPWSGLPRGSRCCIYSYTYIICDYACIYVSMYLSMHTNDVCKMRVVVMFEMPWMHTHSLVCVQLCACIYLDAMDAYTQTCVCACIYLAMCVCTHAYSVYVYTYTTIFMHHMQI